MANIEPIAFRLSLIIVIINLFLFIGGFIPSSSVPVISRTLHNIDINSPDSATFQNNLYLQTDGNVGAASFVNQSSINSFLDLAGQIPIIGPIIDIFRILYELLMTAAFGIVIVMNRMNLPSPIIVITSITILLVMTIGLYEHIMSFIAQRGGSR